MTATAARRLRAGTAAVLLGASCLVAGCWRPPHDAPRAGPPEVPRLDGPASPPPPPLGLRPASLSSGAQAHLPAFDGDRFSVTLSAATSPLSPPDVKAQIVDGIVDAIGAAGVTLTPLASARAQPRASVDALLATSAPAYVSAKELAATERAEGRAPGRVRAELERREVLHVFAQLVDGVPLEHAGVIVAQREGRGPHAVSGALLARVTIVNRRVLEAAAAGAAATRGIRSLPGITAAGPAGVIGGPTPVALAYGRDGAGQARVHHAYRVDVTARFRRMAAPFRTWVDAETGRLLKVEPLFSAIAAQGRAWVDDPAAATAVVPFDVDAAKSSKYTLRLGTIFDRLDFRGDGYTSRDVSIKKSSGGSSGTLAQFDQAPLNDPATAVCSAGANRKFQQIHAYATLSAMRARVVAAGIYEPFPATPWRVIIEQGAEGDPAGTECQSWSTMSFGACAGFYATGCPDWTTTDAQEAQLNHAHDRSMLGHELGHNITLRLTALRPADWCGLAPCPAVRNPGGLHDLADFWAAHLLSNNCIGGWLAKNVGGTNQSRNCTPGHHEDWLLPRKLEITPTLDPARPADHFPERRAPGQAECGEYCGGQMGGAALWEVRAGLERRFPGLGIALFGARLQSAMRRTGLAPDPINPPYTDTQMYRLLNEIAVELTREWVGVADADSANKVAAGFARAGVFLIPYQCLAVSGAPADSCPPGHGGGDAVIDVDADYVAAGGGAPTFHVWTGPRYRLTVPFGAAVIQNPPPCHPAFRVEISSDAAFSAGATVTTAWLPVNTQALSDGVGDCHATWSPTPAQWTQVKTGAARVYYRVATRDASGGNDRLSTSLGQGLFAVPPPYVLITAGGGPVP